MPGKMHHKKMAYPDCDRNWHCGGIWNQAIRMMVIILCFGAEISAEYCRAKALSFNPDADAKFAVISSMSVSSSGQECDEMTLAGIHHVAVIQWTVDRINTGGYIPGVTLGFDVYDDCGSGRYSVNAALDAVSPTFPGDLTDCTSSNKTRLHLGILGPTRSQTAAAVLDILQGTNIPVVSPSATLPELRNFPNFIRTTPSDTEQVKAIVALLKELGWTYVSAIHTDDNYGTYGIKGVTELAKRHGICVDLVSSIPVEGTSDTDVITDILTRLRKNVRRTGDGKESWSHGVIYFGLKNPLKQLLKHARSTSSTYPELTKIKWVMSDSVGTSIDVWRDLDEYGNGALTLSPASEMIPDIGSVFSQKVNQTDNVIMDNVDVMLRSYMANHAGDSFNEWRIDYLMSTVNAVFVMATGLKDAHGRVCNSAHGVCTDLLQVDWLQQMKSTSVDYSDMPTAIAPHEFSAKKKTVTFDHNGELTLDEQSPLYFINMYEFSRSYIQIGNFANGTVSLNFAISGNIDPVPESSCSQDCSHCITDPIIPFASMDGDVFLLGIFSVHDPSASDPFQCDQFRSNSFDIIAMEGFFHAVQRLRELTNVSFGAIAFDDCYSSARINFLLSQFFNGVVPLYTSENRRITPDKVIAIIGPMSSGVTIPVTLLANSLKLPVTSYAASSPDLDDRINFPYFLRTVPSDVKQASAMVKILQRMGWDYVGLLYTNNNYGSQGKQTFHNLAKVNNICVAPPISIPEASDDNTNVLLHSVVNDLRLQNAKVVVYFGTDTQIKNLLEVIENQIENQNLGGKFIFLASEDWGDSDAILRAAPKVTRGSITLKFEISHSRDKGFAENKQFPTYLRNVTPSTNKRNPWFGTFWSEYFKCDLKGSFNIRFNTFCENRHFTAEDVGTFMSDQRLIHTMNAVYAMGQGLMELHTQIPVCKTEFPCKYYHDKAILDLAVSYVRNTSLNDGGTLFRVFNDDSNGNIGFKIMNIQRSGDDSTGYKEVGRFDGKLTLATENMVFYDSLGRPTQIQATCEVNCPGCRPLSSSTVSPTEPTTLLPCTDGFMFRMPDIIVIGAIGFLFFVLIILLICITAYFRGRLKGLEATVKKSSGPKQYEPVAYINQNDSSGEQSKINFANPNTGDSLEEWRNAQNFLNENHNSNMNGGFGFNNLAFAHSASEPYLHAVNENQYDMTRTPNGHVVREFDFEQYQEDLPAHMLPDSPPFQTSCFGVKVPGYFKRMQENPPSPDLYNVNAPSRTLPSPPGAQVHRDLRSRELPNLPTPESAGSGPNRSGDLQHLTSPSSNGSSPMRPPDQFMSSSPPGDVTPTMPHSGNVALVSTPSPSYITLPRNPHHLPESVHNRNVSPMERISRV